VRGVSDADAENVARRWCVTTVNKYVPPGIYAR
jgi:hypothetical protein